MRRPKNLSSESVWLLLAGACGIVLAVASRLTWMRMEGYPMTGMDDYMNRSGVRRSPGLMTLITGALVVLAATVAALRPRRDTYALLVGACVLGVMAVGWGWLAVRAYVDFEGGGDVREPGLWVATAAAVVALASSVAALVRSRPHTPSATG